MQHTFACQLAINMNHSLEAPTPPHPKQACNLSSLASCWKVRIWYAPKQRRGGSERCEVGFMHLWVFWAAGKSAGSRQVENGREGVAWNWEQKTDVSLLGQARGSPGSRRRLCSEHWWVALWDFMFSQDMSCVSSSAHNVLAYKCGFAGWR